MWAPGNIPGVAVQEICTNCGKFTKVAENAATRQFLLFLQ